MCAAHPAVLTAAGHCGPQLVPSSSGGASLANPLLLQLGLSSSCVQQGSGAGALSGPGSNCGHLLRHLLAPTVAGPRRGDWKCKQWHSPVPLILVGSLKFWGAPEVPQSSCDGLFFAVQTLFSVPCLRRGVRWVCSWVELWVLLCCRLGPAQTQAT